MSMIFSFFAMPDEVTSLWSWIGRMPGVRFIETSSRSGLPNREFDSYPAIELARYDRAFGVEAWQSHAGGTPIAKYVRFEPSTAQRLKAAGRTDLISPAIFNIHQNFRPNDVRIGPCELAFWTGKLALKSKRFSKEQIASVDWSIHQRTIAEIKKHIRKSSAAKWRSTPVSAGVAAYLERTGAKLWLWGATGTI